jgi:hypothetical protein
MGKITVLLSLGEDNIQNLLKRSEYFAGTTALEYLWWVLKIHFFDFFQT